VSNVLFGPGTTAIIGASGVCTHAANTIVAGKTRVI
jgi:hypothetical protein